MRLLKTIKIGELTFTYDPTNHGMYRVTGCIETGISHVCIVTERQLAAPGLVEDERVRYYLTTGRIFPNQNTDLSGIADVTEALNLAVEEHDDEEICLPVSDQEGIPEIPEETPPTD